MKIIKNKKKNKLYKYKSKVNLQYKKMLNDEIGKNEIRHRDEIDKLKKNYEERLLIKDTDFEQELKIIRDQERNKFNSIVHEREREIIRLQEYIKNKKEYFEAINNREYKFEDMTRKILNEYQRGLDKVMEGIATMNSVQGSIENYNRKQLKKDSKNIIKEQ